MIEGLNAKIAIPQSDFFALSSTLETVLFAAYRRGNIAIFQITLKVTADINNYEEILTMKPPYIPLVEDVFSARNISTPYSEIGTLWINPTNGVGSLYTSTPLKSGARFYLLGKLMF